MHFTEIVNPSFESFKIVGLNGSHHPSHLRRRACTRLTGVPVATRRDRRTHLLPTAVGHSVIYGPVLAAEQGAEEGLLLACGEERGWRFQGGGGRPTLSLVRTTCGARGRAK